MTHRVHFHPRVKVQAQNGQDLASEALNDMSHVSLEKMNGPGETMPATGIILGVVATLISIGVLITWIMGLVRAGKCQGTNSAFFWIMLFVFLLIPGPGTIAGFAMAVTALVMLKPGSKALGMNCPK